MKYILWIVTVINDLSFKINRSEVLTVIGQNGIGKSTLLRVLTGQQKKYEGEVFVDGKNIKEYTIRELSHKIAIVSAKFNPYQDLCVADYLLTGFANQLIGMQTPDKYMVEQAYDILKIFNKEKLFNKSINQISSGDQQIIMITRALLQKPEIILFDEPTATLDVNNQMIVLEHIRRLSQDGYTIITTSHNPGHAITIGGKVLLLSHNEYVFGDVEDVFSETNLKKVYSLTANIIPNDRDCIKFTGDRKTILYF